MRVLLDENVPVELVAELPDHEVVHVKNLGWKGISNGELLRRAVDEHFDVLASISPDDVTDRLAASWPRM